MSKAPIAPLVLPAPLLRRLDALTLAYLTPDDRAPFDFSRPPGEPALMAPESVSWRLFKNPAALFIGGVAAVILELAEPGVRTGVWEHSSFRADPVRRLRRTGLAAMISVYGPRNAAEAMIAGVGRMHARVAGRTPAGRLYSAGDPDLLRWVQATTGFGFGAAYSRYVRPLAPAELDRLYQESAPASRLYGVTGGPRTQGELLALIQAMTPHLEPSAILQEFLRIMRTASAFPAPLRPLQRLYVRAAVDLIPAPIRARLALGPALGLRPGEGLLVRQAARLSDRIIVRSSPAVQACLRLGLAEDYLYRG
jgi:uncharacterized protein (DUF2236 family)